MMNSRLTLMNMMLSFFTPLFQLFGSRRNRVAAVELDY